MATTAADGKEKKTSGCSKSYTRFIHDRGMDVDGRLWPPDIPMIWPLAIKIISIKPEQIFRKGQKHRIHDGLISPRYLLNNAMCWALCRKSRSAADGKRKRIQQAGGQRDMRRYYFSLCRVWMPRVVLFMDALFIK